MDDTTIVEIVTENLRQVREDRFGKESLNRFAQLAEVSAPHVSEIETGKRNPTLDEVIKISLALNYPILYRDRTTRMVKVT